MKKFQNKQKIVKVSKIIRAILFAGLILRIMTTPIFLGASTLVVGGSAANEFTKPDENHPKDVPTIKHETTVIALVNLDDFKAALLEYRDWFPNHADSITSRQIIREGRRYEDQKVKDAHVEIEIVKINFSNGIIEARENGKDVVYRFKSDEKSNGGLKEARLRLNDAGFDGAVYLCAAMNGRTLLIHQDANNQLPVAVATNPRNKAEAIQSLRSVLSEKGFAVIPDGNKFEEVIPNKLAKNMNPVSTNSVASKADDNEPGGVFLMRNVPFPQIRDVYASLSGREIVQEGALPTVTLSFRFNNSLTKSDLLHAIDVLLGWQGIKIVAVDEKTSKAIWSR